MQRLILLLMACALLPMRLSAAGAPPVSRPLTLLARSDRHYRQKSYGFALQGYRQLLQSGQAPADRREDIRYRIGVCLGKTEQWDRAVAWSLDFVKTHRGTVWEPRGLYWLGRLYLALPPNGWQVGDRIYRGNDVPQTDADARPEPVRLDTQDARNAKDALEAAHVLYPAYRSRAHAVNEEIQLDFDLAQTLQADTSFIDGYPNEERKWPPASDPYWRIDPYALYDASWALPKKEMALFADIQALAPRTHQAALALFGQALFLHAYRSQMQYVARAYKNGKWIALRYPYEDRTPEQPLRRLLREYPGDPLCVEARLVLGRLRAEQGDFIGAIREYRQLAAAYPRSPWASNARAQTQEIQLRRLSLNVPPNHLTGSAPHADLQFRNVTRIRVRIYRLRLSAVLDRPRWRRDTERNPGSFAGLFGSVREAVAAGGAPIAAWEMATGDDGTHRPHTRSVLLPVKQAGAYLVEASAPGVRAAGLLLLSDLALVQKTHRDGALLFLADARTGAPATGGRILAKQWWTEGEKDHTTLLRGTTGRDGLLSVPFAHAPGRAGFQIAAVAYRGEHYAMTGMISASDSEGASQFKVFGTTDRAVYRPAQTVHYRQLVLRRLGGRMAPLAGRRIKVQINDARGKQIYKQLRLPDAFGSVSGDLRLASDAPLGEYSIDVSLPGNRGAAEDIGQSSFRVEDYKKPDFEVTVQPTADRVRLGEPATARVHAAYYFGGPVADAKVTYRVYRTEYAQTYHFPQPYDFLYANSSAGGYDTDYRRGEVVLQGTARLDASGDARITIPTQEDAQKIKDTDFTYTIEADVQDPSRRVISGVGAVNATRHDVAVFLNDPRGYATQGDLVEVEVRTLNPSDQPVSVAGTAQVFLKPEDPKAKERLIWSEPLQTDAQGRAYIRWTARRAGYYRLAFVTQDTAGQKVSEDTPVWVDGPDLRQKRFLFQGLELHIQNPYIPEGGTAKVLLVAPEPGCTVLLTRQADNVILSKSVLHIKDRSIVIALPVTSGDAPNVYLSAVMVRHGEQFEASEELFVPPVRQLSTVTVQADKARYLPGEKAQFHLHAIDWQGRPLRAELSVAVSDAALGYIQKDYAPDIRAYFYGDQRSDSVETSASSQMDVVSGREDTQRRLSYTEHEMTLPDGMGLLEDWPNPIPHRMDPFLISWKNYDTGSVAGGPAGPAKMIASDASGGPVLTHVPYANGRLSSGDFGTYGGLPRPVFALTRPPANTVILGGNADIQKWREVPAAPRRPFLDTAFWTPAVVTDSQGNATVTVTWPDNLTQWRAVTAGDTTAGQVGAAETRVTTRKDLLVRLQTPRFCVERDRVVFSANVHNYLPSAAHIRVRLDLSGGLAEIEPQTKSAAGDPAETWIDLPANAEKRVDWNVQIAKPGLLDVRMIAECPAASDAAEVTVPVLVHGVERTVASGGTLRDRNTAALPIVLPEARKPGSAALVVRLDPSLARVMLGALPGLADYPYGCTEQTMSRFLPAVVLAASLKELGYNLNAVKDLPAAKGHPALDPARLRSMTAAGLARLAQFQHADGGWGWWANDSADTEMSAYVVDGLLLAKKAGIRVDAEMLDRGLAFLLQRFRQEDDLQRLASLARVLARVPRYRSALQKPVLDRLYTHRERLSAYTKALLALALHDLGDGEQAGITLRNLEGTAVVDEANGTASWDANGSAWWRWYNDRAETNAAVLEAYLAVDPHNHLTPMIMKWLVNNRHGSAWSSTRETALAVIALADYARAFHEMAPNYILTLDLGGRIRRTVRIDHRNALLAENGIVLPDSMLRTGAEPLTLTKDGPGTCYYSVALSYLSEEEPIRATGREIFLRRRYFRLMHGTASGAPEPQPMDAHRSNPFLTGRYDLLGEGGVEEGSPDTTEGPRYQRIALNEGDTLSSGDLVEVELQIESKNDVDYLCFEDRKPSGCEPFEVRSGSRSESGVYANMELQDEKVAFFLDNLPQGTRTLTYRLYAEEPGRFHVLPADGYAMYAPDIHALSDETSLRIQDETPLQASQAR